MKITVILCTYNRCQDLAKALNSFAVQTLPTTTDWEVLVMDNNSTDGTRELATGFCGRYPNRFRYLYEPRPGKSYALNTGIREARGDVLAFTDDDVTVEPTWLQNLTASLHNGEWAGAGGRTLPQEAFAPPRWLSSKGQYALAPLALFDRGSQAGDLNEAPFGNNMAYRKAMFEKHGGFRNDLGPRAGSKDPQKSEDGEFGDRLLAAGERLRYEPSAVLYHSVPQSRIQKKYFRSWWFDKSRADVRAYGVPSDTNWFVFGIPLYMFRRLAMWTLRWMIAIEPAARFDRKIKVWQVAGTIVECHRMSLDATAKREANVRT